MTTIRPFQAVHFNPQKIKDLSKVVCPPYDVISPEQQDALHNQSEHNFIHILLGKDKKSDDRKTNKYTRAREMYDRWIKQEVLVRDARPAIYYYRQEFRVMGQKYSRLGFKALMKLEDEKDAKIFPHENTHSKAKEDRFKLWKAVGANLSPIFVCFSDRDRKVEKIFVRDVATQAPMMDVLDDDEVRHAVWRMEDPILIRQITDSVGAQPLFIADGHHRYEVARDYRQFRIGKEGGKPDPEAPYQFVMTYFTNFDSRDLRIFPMHRILRQLPAPLDFLEEHFRLDKIKAKGDLLIMLARAGRNEHAFGLYTRDGLWLLRLKSKLLVERMIKSGSTDFRRLDATILKHFVFDRIGVKTEEIAYTNDADEVSRRVDEGQAEAGFLMNPVKIQQLKNVALNGERMPPKTTYFYPKVLSGLTINPMD